MMRHWLTAVVLLVSLSPALAAGEGAPKPFERGSWQKLLLAHAGHPTLVHFWGVTCGPCKVELPELGQFMKDHPGIDVVTISADLVPNLPDATRSMLDRAGLGSRGGWTREGRARGRWTYPMTTRTHGVPMGPRRPKDQLR